MSPSVRPSIAIKRFIAQPNDERANGGGRGGRKWRKAKGLSSDDGGGGGGRKWRKAKGLSSDGGNGGGN